MTAQPSIPPTVSTSNLCSLAADLAVNQILRLALRLGEPVFDTTIEFCGFTNRSVTSRLTRNANCPIDHAKWSLAALEKPLAKTTPGELAKVVGLGVNTGPVTFTVDGFGWVESGVCQCDSPKVVRRFVPAGRKQVGLCPKCRQPILAQPIFTHRNVAAALLGKALEMPLDELGAAKARCVLVGNDAESVLFREPDTQPSAHEH